MPLKRRLRPAIKIVKLIAIRQTTLDHELFTITINRHRISRVSLQLDCIRTGLMSRINSLQCALKGAVIVGGQLINDVRSPTGTNNSAIN